MKVEARISSTENKIVDIVPNSEKICSCGAKILYKVTYINKKGERTWTPIVEIEEEIKMLDNTVKKFIIKKNHFIDCPDWKLYHK